MPLWFASLRANVEPTRTGLVFVVPAADTTTRDVITAFGRDYAWVEVLRDKGQPKTRADRPGDRHENLAVARNQILRVVEQVRPAHYLSWDTDLLLAPGTVPLLRDLPLPLITVWTWLNRQAPRMLTFDGQPTLWQPPVAATAMDWDRHQPMRPVHYPGADFNRRASGLWRCGVALAVQLMDARAYRHARYGPHHDGEDVVFNAMLAAREVSRFCWGDTLGVHLYDRHADGEIAMGWPGVMELGKQRPLAATRRDESRSAVYQAAGLYPVDTEEHDGRGHEADGRGADGAR